MASPPATPSDADGELGSNGAAALVAANGQSDADTKILQKVMQGVHTFSRICAVYDLNDILNNLIIALCNTLCRFLEEVAEVRLCVCVFTSCQFAELAFECSSGVPRQHGA